MNDEKSVGASEYMKERESFSDLQNDVTVEAQPVQPEVTSGRTFESQSPNAIEPNNNGMIAFRMKNAAQIVNIESDEGVEVVQIFAGTQVAKEEGVSWRDMLTKINLRFREGATVTVIAKNTSPSLQMLKVRITVDKLEASLNGARSSSNEQPRTDSRASRTVAVQEQFQRHVGSSVHRFNQKPKDHGRNVQKVNKTSEPIRNVAAVRHENGQPLTMLLPSGKEKSVLLARGHAHGMLRLFSSRVPIHESFRYAIVSQLLLGKTRQGAVSEGGNEIVVMFQDHEIDIMVFQLRHKNDELPSTVKDSVIAALKSAIERDENNAKQNRKVESEVSPGE